MRPAYESIRKKREYYRVFISINLRMRHESKVLLDQLIQLFRAELQPFKGRGRAKELAYASFKRQAKAYISAYELSVPSKLRKYSLTRRGLERKRLAIVKMHQTMNSGDS